MKLVEKKREELKTIDPRDVNKGQTVAATCYGKAYLLVQLPKEREFFWTAVRDIWHYNAHLKHEGALYKTIEDAIAYGFSGPAKFYVFDREEVQTAIFELIDKEAK